MEKSESTGRTTNFEDNNENEFHHLFSNKIFAVSDINLSDIYETKSNPSSMKNKARLS